MSVCASFRRGGVSPFLFRFVGVYLATLAVVHWIYVRTRMYNDFDVNLTHFFFFFSSSPASTHSVTTVSRGVDGVGALRGPNRIGRAPYWNV